MFYGIGTAEKFQKQSVYGHFTRKPTAFLYTSFLRRVLLFIFDAFCQIPLFHGTHGNQMADNDISQYQQNGKQIFRPAIGKNVFSGTGTQLLQSKPGNTDANGQTNNARENELQK